jgi:hypothetical protein
MSTSLFLSKLLFILLLSAVISVSAQEQTTNQWKFLIEPYMMFPAMKGSTGIGDLPELNVDADAGDILGKLKMGAMLYVEASSPKWAICSDIIYMNLEQDVKTGSVVQGGYLQAKQFAWEVSGLRNVLPWLDLGIGLRLNSLEAGAEITTGVGSNVTQRSQSQKETWIDPILIARAQNMMGTNWFYLFRGDIGGFGIGSDFAWQLQGYIGYRVSKLFQLSGGYRIIGIDYESGSGSEYFLYDIDTSGPVVRLGFNL